MSRQERVRWTKTAPKHPGLYWVLFRHYTTAEIVGFDGSDVLDPHVDRLGFPAAPLGENGADIVLWSKRAIRQLPVDRQALALAEEYTRVSIADSIGQFL